MKVFFIFSAFVLLLSCASSNRGPAGSSFHKAHVYFEFLDSGADEEHKNYDVYAEVFTPDPSLVKEIGLIVDGKKKQSVPLISSPDGKNFIKLSVPYHLPIHSTLFHVQMKNGDTRFIELECTREDQCLE